MWAEEADKYWKKADVQRAKKRQFKVSQPPSQPASEQLTTANKGLERYWCRGLEQGPAVARSSHLSGSKKRRRQQLWLTD